MSSFRLQIDAALQNPIVRPDNQAGRGIVVWAGGAHDFTGAWVLVRCLRELGCQLPVQFWHVGDEVPDGIDEEMRTLVLPLGVECVDAAQVAGSSAVPRNSQQRKLCSVVHCKFLEVLLLDPHNLPIKNPEYLFEDVDYQSASALFWQGIRQDPPDPDYWNLLGVPYRPGPEIDLGQILVHKGLRWDCLALAWWLQGNTELFESKIFRHVNTPSSYEAGRSLFRFAWDRCGAPLLYPLDSPQVLTPLGLPPDSAVVCQPDMDGNRLFQHRLGVLAWRLIGPNYPVSGAFLEPMCLQQVAELRAQWSGRVGNGSKHRDHSGSPEVLSELLTETWVLLCITTPPETAEESDGVDGPKVDKDPWTELTASSTATLEFDSSESSAAILERRTVPGAFVYKGPHRLPAGEAATTFLTLKFEPKGRLGKYENASFAFWDLDKHGNVSWLRLRELNHKLDEGIQLTRLNHHVWQGEQKSARTLTRYRMIPLSRFAPGSDEQGASVYDENVLRKMVRRKAEKILRLVNSSPEFGDHVVSVYAAAAAAKAGLKVELYTAHAAWLGRVRQSGLSILPEQSDGNKKLSSSDQHLVCELNYAYGYQNSHARSRAQWYASAILPHLAPCRPEVIDTQVQSRRLDFPSYVVVAPKSRMQPAGFHQEVKSEARSRPHLPVPPPPPRPRAHEWPKVHWQRLVDELSWLGHQVIAVGLQDDQKYLEDIFGATTALWVAGEAPGWYIDMMLGATATVANDNGMADVAGLLNVPTVALHSHFPVEFMWDCTSIRGVSSRTDCTHCRARIDRGYTAACLNACSALTTIGPELVAAEVAKLASQSEKTRTTQPWSK